MGVFSDGLSTPASTTENRGAVERTPPPLNRRLDVVIDVKRSRGLPAVEQTQVAWLKSIDSIHLAEF